MLLLAVPSFGSTTNQSTMADSPTDPFARGLIIPPTVCDNILDTSAHGDWDDIEHYVFTEVTAITRRCSQLCDAADQGDASAITQVASLVRLQAKLLRASGFSSQAEFIDSILGPNLLDRIQAWYSQRPSTQPTTSNTHSSSPCP